jgi:hypothetical protein
MLIAKTAEKVAKSLFERSNGRKNEGTMAFFNFHDHRK